MGDHQSRFLWNQLGLPLLVSMLMRNFLVSSQHSSNIENPRPGIPSMKKLRGRPPNTLLTPGTYSRKMKTSVSDNTPPNMCLLNPE